MNKSKQRIGRMALPFSVAAALLAPAPAQAVNYQDLWWNPLESGWGVNIVQQATTLFATWFVYDAANAPTWVVMSSGTQGTGETFSGTLFRTSGPAFSGATFDPGAVTATPVGTATFSFSNPYQATLTYTVNGTTVTKSITRQTFKALPVAGTYRVLDRGQTAGCTVNPSWNGPLESTHNTITLSTSGSAVTAQVTERDDAGVLLGNFTLTGTFTQYGSVASVSLAMTNYTLALDEVQFTEYGFTAKVVGRTLNDTCVDTTVMTGLRN